MFEAKGSSFTRDVPPALSDPPKFLWMIPGRARNAGESPRDEGGRLTLHGVKIAIWYGGTE